MYREKYNYETFKNLGKVEKEDINELYIPFEIKSLKDKENILKNNKNKLVLIKVYADWCYPCVLIKDKYIELNKKYSSYNICLYTENIDNGLTSDCNAVPMFDFYINNELVNRIYAGNIPHIDDILYNYTKTGKLDI